QWREGTLRMRIIYLRIAYLIAFAGTLAAACTGPLAPQQTDAQSTVAPPTISQPAVPQRIPPQAIPPPPTAPQVVPPRAVAPQPIARQQIAVSNSNGANTIRNIAAQSQC